MRTIIFFLSLTMFSCQQEHSLTERRLRYYLASKTEGGSVFYQAASSGVDYRQLLRGATAKDSASLAGIFRFSVEGGVMGEGAESHCEILYELLRLWGDAAYARVLSRQSPDVRAKVIADLDYQWAHPGWQATEFPITYRLAQHSRR
jgi:hypothetical protein